MRSRRALLYMPGTDDKKIRKAIQLEVDCICMDLEDGVSPNRKDEARRTICNALDNYDFYQSEKIVRINPLNSPFALDDLKVILPHHPQSIVIPKVKSAAEIRSVSAIISIFENKYGWPLGSIRLFAIIETPMAFLNLNEIAQSDSRLEVLIFGAEDLMGDIGGKRSRSSQEVLFARSTLVLHAAAFNLQAIDMVYLDFNDSVGLEEECRQGVALGYWGKQIIHPNQVSIVQNAFTPTDEEIHQAIALIKSFEDYKQSGIGAFAVNGKLVDAPIIKSAENILVKARAAKKIG